jgi:hypothetical protein
MRHKSYLHFVSLFTFVAVAFGTGTAHVAVPAKTDAMASSRPAHLASPPHGQRHRNHGAHGRRALGRRALGRRALGRTV